MSLLTSVNKLAVESIKSCKENLKKMTTEEFGTSKEITDRLNANIDSAHRAIADVKTTLSREKLIDFIENGIMPPELVFGKRGEVSAACVRLCNRYSVAFSRNIEGCCAVKKSNNDRLFSTDPSDFVFVEDTYPLVKMDGDEAVFLTGVCLSSDENEEETNGDKKIIINATSYAKANTDDIFGLSRKEDNINDASGDEDECSGKTVSTSKKVLRVFNGKDDSPAFSLSKLQVDDLKYGWGNKDSMSIRDSAMGFSSTRSMVKQMNDMRCFSHMFNVEVLGDTGTISIVLENGPDLYNSEPVNFSDQLAAIESNSVDNEEGAVELNATAVSSALAATAERVVDVLSPLSTTDAYSPTRKRETNKMPPLFSCEESVAKGISNLSREIMFNETKSKHRRGLLMYKDILSSSVPTLYNPILIGAKEFLEYEKRRELLNGKIDIQNALFRVFKLSTQKIGDGSISKSKMNGMMEQIGRVFDSEKDVDIATCLLKDEVEATRISQAITKEIMSSVPVIGKMGADHSIFIQRERVEGMRGVHDIGIHSLDKNTADDSLAIMTEYVTKWMKTVFKPVLNNDSKGQYAAFKSYFSETKKNDNNKRPRKSEGSRKQGETLKSNKRAKIKTGPQEEHYIKESTDRIVPVTAVSVLPPSFVSEPKEAVSDAVFSECIHNYAQDVAHSIISFSRPKREVTLASLTNVVPKIKKKVSDIMGKLAVTSRHIIRPVEIFSVPPNNIRIGEVQANKMKNLFVKQPDCCVAEENNKYTIKSKLNNIISSSTSFNHNIPVSDDKEYDISKNLYGALNMRRLAEENAAFKHLSNVMILENICRILSGQSTKYSLTIQNAFKWYLTVLIRNRICDNIPMFIKSTTIYGSIADDQKNLVNLSEQIYGAIKWFINFDIPHRIVLHPEIGEKDVVPGNYDIFKPGVRQAAIIPHEYIGSSYYPIEMTTLCPGSSIPKLVRIDGKHADTLLCVNNYNSGNLIMISMSRVKTLKECESIMSEEAAAKKTMSSLFPDSVMKSSSSNTLSLVTGGGSRKSSKEITRHSTDYHLFRNAHKVQYTSEDFLDENEAIPLIMYCSFNNWRKLPLFGVDFSRFKLKLDITKSSKMLLSVGERISRNSTLDGLLYRSYVDSIDKFFVKKPTGVYDSISDFDIVVYSCKNDRAKEFQPVKLARCHFVNESLYVELARCHFVNESLYEGSDSAIFLPRYRATSVKNASAVRKVISENFKKSFNNAKSNEKCIIKCSSASAAQLLPPVCNSSLHPYMNKIHKIIRSNEKRKLKYMKRRRQCLPTPSRDR